ncbi:MAG: DUF1592 domain-containing protein, partial [Myxococcota bacterium]|nr:DUF1592 domain-containing protein [Myxococcota bacterium]
LEAGEAERIAGVYDVLAPEVGRRDALARAMQTIFLAPEFLYLTSIGRADGAELLPYELASRLSFFLWAAPPDAALLDAASRDELREPAALEAHARRMVRDPRAGRSVARFVLGWTGALDLAAEPKRDPAWGSELLGDVLAETDLFVRDWWTSGAPSMRALFVADHTFVTPRLAALYGLPAPASSEPTRIDGTSSAHRGGLLTQASFLAAHALDAAPSSTLRGHWFLERALCQEIGGAPAAANALAPRFEEGMTLREWHEAIETNPGCSGCHMRMEPLGYALERFDAIGRVRTEDHGRPVRTDATLRTSTELDGSYEGERDLSEAVGESPTVRACFARHWIAYALGRPATQAERELEARVGEALEHDAHEAAIAIVTAPAFRRARAEEE